MAAANRTLRVGLVGGGIGGLTAALALSQRGFETHIFEQAGELREIGAGITLSPNAVKALRVLGLEGALRARGFESDAIVGRDWKTARPTFRVALRGASQARFGAPHLDIHRADLLDILASAAGAASRIQLGHRCVAVSSTPEGATLMLTDGREEEFDLVVGCDGIHSTVRTALHGAQAPRFTGNVCWRALIPAEQLQTRPPPDVAIWTGPGGHIVTFYIRGGALLNLVAVREVSRWVQESWLVEGSANELVATYPEVHENIRALLRRTEHCFKWGLFDRDPLPRWSSGRITLLGDAAHPMLPFLAQGAAMAIEDGAVLTRALTMADTVEEGLQIYQRNRVDRTARIVRQSTENRRLFHLRSEAEIRAAFANRDEGAERNKWLYSYNPMTVPLV
jgi:salicylate hydroxylase